ncbi:glycosyl hydrolases family 31-domain-containing protein [Mycena amicta]|nr:glycosyl hydrolases family 31-domain-containing protein [Mycena amicta]
MKEPSVFNGPEISMPRDNIQYNGWEHRDVHNINGMLFSNHTWQAVRERTDPPTRPFVLTGSFFADSQRFGAMWTGDNLGTWEHMEVGNKMVLANSGDEFLGLWVLPSLNRLEAQPERPHTSAASYELAVLTTVSPFAASLQRKLFREHLRLISP